MPLYEYQCEPCGHRFEVIQKFSDAPPVCPKCGGPVEKLVSSPAIQFKGSGFYLTDYGRGGKSDTAPSQDGTASAGEKAEKSATGEKADKAEKSAKSPKGDSAPSTGSSGESAGGTKASESKPAAPAKTD
jgi:putative FmdB family regulatory protein